MNSNEVLYIITHDYPYGKGETFLETEINYAKEYFKSVVIISTSDNRKITRSVPNDVTIVKLSRKYKILKCICYSIFKIFSIGSINEFERAKRIYGFPRKRLLMEILRYYLIEKRICEYFKTRTSKKIIYIYWYSYYAVALSKNRNHIFVDKIITRMHSSEVQRELSYIPFRKYSNRNIDKIYAISNSVKKIYDNLMTFYNENAISVYISRLGVQIPLVTNWSHTDNCILIVSCSNVVDIKRLDIIVEALSKIFGCNLYWNHFGDGPALQNIKTLANRMLDKKVNIKYKFWGSISNASLYEYYRCNRVDIFINSSESEGIPVAIMEAMSYGIPCIARNVGGIGEIVEDGKNGVLLEKSATSLHYFTAINYMIYLINSDIDKYNSMRMCSREIIKLKYNADINYRNFYEDIAN